MTIAVHIALTDPQNDINTNFNYNDYPKTGKYYNPERKFP